MAQNDFAPRVESVRRFNRFYTKQIGVLSEHVLKTQYSLAEARVIYELAQREKATATEMGAELGLDAGHLSRLLAAFKKKGLISRKPSDARIGPATWAGSHIGMASSTTKSTAGMKSSRRWWLRSRRNSSVTTTLSANGVGSPNAAARSPAVCSSSKNRRRWPNYDCCWSSRARGGWASASAWSMNACCSPGR